MSEPEWPKKLASELESTLKGYKSPFTGLSSRQYTSALRHGIRQAPFESIAKDAIIAIEAEKTTSASKS
jgi:hypothetical protein